MIVRRFALVMGIVFLAVGILGFVPGINSMHGHDPNLTVEGPGHGYLMGLFHVNLLHNLVHVLFGAMGIAMAGTFARARAYARFVAIAYIVLAIMGLIAAANTWYMWGLAPLHGNDVWLHVVIAAAAAYFGYAVRAPGDDATDVRGPTETAPRI